MNNGERDADITFALLIFKQLLRKKQKKVCERFEFLYPKSSASQ